jgi:hypothetical protein
VHKTVFSEFNPSRTLLLLAVLCLLHLTPIWAFKFIPTHDGLSHLYNAYILKEWRNPDFSKFHEVYDLNLKFFPNWSSHAFFFLALHVFPPLIAEKIFVSICVLLFPLSFYYLLKAVDERLRLFGMLGFLYSYNFPLQMGFYNFALSVPISLITIGYFWKHLGNFQIRHGVILNLLLIAVYFSHFSSYVFLVFALSFFAGVYFLGDRPKDILSARHELERSPESALGRGWRSSLSDAPQWRERLSKLVQSAGYVIPSYFILLYMILANPEDGKTVYKKTLAELVEYFVNVRSLVYFNDSYLPVSWMLLGFVSFCSFWTLAHRLKENHLVDKRNAFLFLALISTVLFFMLPYAYGTAVWINDRVHLFIFPILLGWFVVPEHVWVKRGLIVAMLVMLMWHLGLTIRDYDKLNDEMSEFVSATHLIRPNSTLSVVEDRTNWHTWSSADQHWEFKNLWPLYTVAPYYGLTSGSHYVGNYEPQYDYFPLRYKNGTSKFDYLAGPIDYMLVWRLDDEHREVKALTQDYELIYRTENLKVFQLRSNIEKL